MSLIDYLSQAIDFIRTCKIRKEVNYKKEDIHVLYNDNIIEKHIFKLVHFKILTIQGLYSKKYRGWVFKYDPTDKIHKILTGENFDYHKNYQLVDVNESTIELFINNLEIQEYDEILIPYAGTGVLCEKIKEKFQNCSIVNIELKKENTDIMIEKNMDVINIDFFKMPVSPTFDFAIAILPDIKNQHIDYFMKMIKCVKDGGKVSVYTTSKFMNSENEKLKDFKKFITLSNIEYMPVSGTHCILSLTINEHNSHLRFI